MFVINICKFSDPDKNNNTTIFYIFVYTSGCNKKRFYKMAKLHLALLIGAVTASLDSFIEEHFSDNTICLVYTTEINYGILPSAQPKILFNVSNLLNEFDSKLFHQRINYLVIVKDVENLVLVIRKLIINQNYNTKEKHLIFIEEDLDSVNLENCFALLWQEDIYNVVIKTANNTSFSTWHPYGKKSSCGNKVVIEINATTPFSNKIPSRFTNCKVKLIWNYYPVLTTNPNGHPLGVINQMLLLIGEKIGLNMHFPQEENQLVYEELFNRTPTTRLAQYISKNRIDIVANMYGPAVTLYLNKTLVTTLPFTIHEDYWLLPPKQPLPSIESFISVLTFQEYVLTSITLFSFMFVWRFASDSFFDAIRIFLQQPIHGNTNYAKKMLLISGLYFAIHVDLLYSSQLIRVLYRPVYPASYKTLNEVLDRTDLKFSYPLYVGRILQNRDIKLWKRVEARTEEVLTSRIYKNVERKKRFLNLEGVLEIGSYDLYYVYNPQDLEVLEEQVS